MMAKKVEALDLQGLPSGGDSWTRTNDPIDVNDVLYHTVGCTFRETIINCIPVSTLIA